MVFSIAQTKSFYDRFGLKQDQQAYYEDPALQDLMLHAEFDKSETVFELGCGTGRLAACLLANHLPESAHYIALDLSETMAGIARSRLSAYAHRACVVLSDGAMRFPVANGSTDRFISTYVMDIFSQQTIDQAIREAKRILAPHGKICLISLSRGVSRWQRGIASLWTSLYKLRPSLVGGCKPTQLAVHLNDQHWSMDYHNTVSKFGISSEVIVASVIAD